MLISQAKSFETFVLFWVVHKEKKAYHIGSIVVTSEWELHQLVQLGFAVYRANALVWLYWHAEADLHTRCFVYNSVEVF